MDDLKSLWWRLLGVAIFVCAVLLWLDPCLESAIQAGFLLGLVGLGRWILYRAASRHPAEDAKK